MLLLFGSWLSTCVRRNLSCKWILAQTNTALESCDDECCICTKKWHEIFIPVYRSGVVGFLEFLMLTGKLPVDVDYKDPISSLLAGSPFWKETVFDRAACTVSQMQVDALFLSLTAAGIIKLEPKNDSSFQWVVAREYGASIKTGSFIEAHMGTPIYKRDESWQGVHLLNDNRVRRRDPSINNN
jgi:hypothetical protein